MSFQMRKKWRWAVAAAAVFVPGIVTGALSLPYTFSAGQPIRAAEVNANFEALRARLDALGTTPAPAAPVGTLTLQGVGSALSIRSFSQSIATPFTGGTVGARPAFSDVQVTFDAGVNDPLIDNYLVQSKVIPTATIVLGNLTVRLTSASITSETIAPPLGTAPQETLTLAFRSIDWIWQVGAGAQTVVSFNVQAATGGGSSTRSFNYGYFAPGVTADTTLIAASAYTHSVSCPVGQKCAFGVFSVQKGIGSETLDELGLAAATTSGVSADLKWFLTAGTVANEVQLGGGFVAGVRIGTSTSGALTEAVDYGYQTIKWTAGANVAAFNLATNAAQ